MRDPLVHPIEDASPDGKPVDLATPPTPQAQAVEREDFREQNDLVAVLATDPGRALVMRVLAHCHPYQANSQPDDYRRGVQEGERRVGLWLLHLIQRAGPLEYSRLLEAHITSLQRLRDQEQALAERERSKRVGVLQLVRSYMPKLHR